MLPGVKHAGMLDGYDLQVVGGGELDVMFDGYNLQVVFSSY